MSAVVILENDNAKIQHILDQNKVFGTENVCIVRSVNAAQLLMGLPIGKVRLLIDYELDPGCGSGFEFLDWVLKEHKNQILEVVIITFSPSWRIEMMKLCKAAGVKVDALKPPFSMDEIV